MVLIIASVWCPLAATVDKYSYSERLSVLPPDGVFALMYECLLPSCGRTGELQVNV